MTAGYLLMAELSLPNTIALSTRCVHWVWLIWTGGMLLTRLDLPGYHRGLTWLELSIRSRSDTTIERIRLLREGKRLYEMFFEEGDRA